MPPSATHGPEAPIEPELIASALAKVALDHRGSDVAILDMRNLVDYTDVFVLCTARNRRHVAALAEHLRLHAKKQLQIPCVGVEGVTAARWVLLDFGSVVVHLFDEPLRGFYNLDGLWGDAPKLAVPESEGEGDSATDDDDDDDDDDEPITSEIELNG
ncbi:MAG: ribosome silencing factor [Myxococcota bacterium]